MSGIMMVALSGGTQTTPGSFSFPDATSYVTMSPGVSFTSATTPFTVEGWFYCDGVPGASSRIPVILSKASGGASNTLTLKATSATTIGVDSSGVGAIQFTVPTMLAQTWYYVALSRNTSGQMRVWCGPRGGTAPASTTWTNTGALGPASGTGVFTCNADYTFAGTSNVIGAFPDASNYGNGSRISGVRVTYTNLYNPSVATIAVPTMTLNGVDGINLLQSPTGVNDMSGLQTLTLISNAVYSSSGPAITIQRYVSPYGSVLFNGTNQSLTATNSSVLNPGTGDFTIEFWTYVNSNNANASFYRASNGGIDVFLNGSGRLAVGQAGISTLISDTVSMTTGAWVHVAAVRTSGILKLYKNGVSLGSASLTADLVTDSVNSIGANPSGYYINGYISNLRFVTGVAVYTGTFTVPTSPLTVTQNASTNISAIVAGQTQLLLNTTNDGYYKKDSSSNNITITAVNSPTSSGSDPFVPAPIVYYDATNSLSYSGSGTTWNNIAPGTTGLYNATLNGSPVYTSGSAGYFYFNRPTTGSTVSNASWSWPNKETYWSFETIVQPQYVSGSYQFVIQPATNYLGVQGGTYNYLDNGSNMQAAGVTPTVGTWVVITVVHGPEGSVIYINGLSKYSVGVVSPVNTSGTWVVGTNNSSTLRTQINMSRFRYWNTGLTASQVLINYNNQKSTYGL